MKRCLSRFKFFFICLMAIVFVTGCQRTGTRQTDSFSPEDVRPNSTSGDLPIPSSWQGMIAGQVHNQQFQIPVQIRLATPMPDEANPLNMLIAPQASQIGDLSLESARQFSTSSGSLTLQYFDINLQGNRLNAVFTDYHKEQAATANIFTAPNVTAEYAPQGPAQDLYSRLGQTEIFAFKEGARSTIDFSGDSLQSVVSGTGVSISGQFPLPDVIYQAKFSARRVR